jgi:signal transduction histidine kinase
LLNLLRNAREAMPDGGAIDLEVEREDDGICIRVRDQGPGVPDDIGEKIFDLFYTTKEHGTGLGLPLTQQVIVSHGGRIRYRGGSAGTTFEVWLPASSSEPPKNGDALEGERSPVP